MKKYNSLVEAFTDTNKEIIKTSPVMEPGDVYLAYCALALCTIADKMTLDNSLERKTGRHFDIQKIQEEMKK